MINHGVEQRVLGVRAQDHLAAVGADRLLVFHQCVQSRRIHADIEKSASMGQRDPFAGSQSDAAFGGIERALIADLFGDQRDVTAVAGFDRSLIDHVAAAGSGKRKLAGGCPAEEICIGNIQCACNQTADINLGAGTKRNAVRVDQENLAIGQQLTEDRRRIAGGYAI